MNDEEIDVEKIIFDVVWLRRKAMFVREEKLKFWIESGLNVIFVGLQGVGKSEMIKELFNKYFKQHWKYYSAATMDPWVDFIGCPEKVVIGDTKYLDFIRPKELADGKIEAIFFDEFSRSHKKIRNAVMELIQFKTINGEKVFPNLKVIWAAINPSDEEIFQVEPLDPAQIDRFHVQFHVPYKPNGLWFAKTFGERLATSAIDWWDALPEEEKKKVSPRRLEYALRVYEKRHNPGADVRDIIPESSNPSKLITMLNTGPIKEKLDQLFTEQDVIQAKKFLSNENNYAAAIKFITESEKQMKFFLPLVNKEKLSVLMTRNDHACKFIMNQSINIPIFLEVCQEILNAGQNEQLVKRIRRNLSNNANVNKKQVEIHFENHRNLWDPLVAKTKTFTGFNDKVKTYNEIVGSIPQKINASDATWCIRTLKEITSDLNPSSLKTLTFEKLVPTINHCLSVLNMDLSTISPELHEKIQDAGLVHELYLAQS
jgi:hypothetical protein